MSTYLEQEIAAQPDDWTALRSRLDEVAPLLPQPGQRVATIGCGTSWFMGQAYAALRESLGQGVSDAFTASEHRLSRGYDLVVVICRSGTTTEVCSVIEQLSADGVPHVSLVATPDSAVANESDRVILLDEIDERSVVQTRFATGALALLRASLGESLDRAVSDARDVLGQDEGQLLGPLREVDQVTFLGSGWTVGLAHEAALKLRETSQFWAESYPAMEYRHGPISIAAPGRATWMIGPLPPGLEEEVRATGAYLEHRDLDPMAELVRVQRLCLQQARRAGLNPDQSRHLTRSIVLP